MNFKSVLGEFPGYTWHVRALPGENVPVLTEKFDEHAFLFIVQSVADGELLGRIVRVNIHLLGMRRRAEIFRHL